MNRTAYDRLRRLNLKPLDLLDKDSDLAFRLTFSEPTERFKHLKNYVGLRRLLAEHNIKTKKDLQVLLGGLNKPDDYL